MPPLLKHPSTHSLGGPGTLRNMSYGFLQNEDFASISRTCTLLYNEVHKLHSALYVHVMKPAMPMRRKSLRANSGSPAPCNRHEYGRSKIVQDRLRPPLRPPRPNLTLGGTNLRDDIEEMSSSTSGSDEGGLVDTVFPAFSIFLADGSFASVVFATFFEIASTPLERCSRWKAREAAELVLRCPVRSMELRLSIPVLTIWKS